MKDITVFAAFMADTLVSVGALRAPRNDEEAQGLIDLVMEKFEQFSQAYDAWCNQQDLN